MSSESAQNIGTGVAGGIIVFVLTWVSKFVNKIITDLPKRGTGGTSSGNGNTGQQPTAFWEKKLDDIREGFDNSLKLSIVPLLKAQQENQERQTDILDEMRKDNRETREMLLKLILRQEVEDRLKAARAAVSGS
jgi:hypothetical protein